MEDGHKETMENGGQNVVDLPPEIMNEILSRLPVKQLCRFKLVSKSWESLISDPDFVANYSKAAFENEDVFFRRRRLLFTNIIESGQHGIYSLDLDQFLSENPNAGVDGLVAAPTELGFVYNLLQRGGSPCYPFVHGPCNGLFLARLCYGDYGYILINPVTKESKKSPKPPLWRPMEPFFGHTYGLGFDHSTNEYKVINGQQYFGGVVFSVYTLQTDSWRQIDCLFPYRDLHNDGVLVNGAVHRLAMKVGNQSWVIISFSLAEDRVREIAVPPNTANQPIQLGAFRDWLCITSLSNSETFNEFWVMKKYRENGSWAKMQVPIPYHRLLHSGFWTSTHDLIMFDIWSHKSLLVMYNFNDDTYWTLSIDKVGAIRCIGIYVETLPPLTHRSRKTSSNLSVTSWDINSHSYRQKLKVD